MSNWRLKRVERRALIESGGTQGSVIVGFFDLARIRFEKVVSSLIYCS